MSQPPAPIETGSVVLSSYAEGNYFEDPSRHQGDALFKANAFLSLFREASTAAPLPIRSMADVGCGTGDVVRLVSEGLQKQGVRLEKILAYDVSPHVAKLSSPDVSYIYGDFCSMGETVDLVTLFDVFEHVPDPIRFLKLAASRCRYLALHIPLDDSFNVAFRDLFRRKLKSPGHLIFLNAVTALNLLTLSGLVVDAYRYTFGFEIPHANHSLASKLAYPLRKAVRRVSPWLLSRTVGGASLIVLARNPAAAP